jgi:hypothetical protein
LQTFVLNLSGFSLYISRLHSAKASAIAQYLYKEPVNGNRYCSISGPALEEPESGQGVNGNEGLTLQYNVVLLQISKMVYNMVNFQKIL